MFTLAITCLTTSNLPWFMDLTFQVPMQYCSLQHRNLLLSPVTSTTGYCFCLGSIPSFFLELFLHWSPVAYWAPTDLGRSSFSILSLEKGMANYFSILALRTPWTVWKRRILDAAKKKIPQVQGLMRSCNKIVLVSQSLLKSNLIPARDSRRVQTNPWVQQDQEKGVVTSTKTEPDLPVNIWMSPEEARVSSGLLQGEGLWQRKS